MAAITLTLSTKVRALEKCDGSEDLKFYLGASDELTERLKKKYVKPTAFAERLSKAVATQRIEVLRAKLRKDSGGAQHKA